MSQKLTPRIAVYTGVFDPVHLGHQDLIHRSSELFDKLIVAVGINPDKKTFFDIHERVALLKKVTADYPNVEVHPFTGLAVRFVREMGAKIMVRGLRTLSDMEYEFAMSLMNLNLDPDIETVFLMAREEFSHVSSSLLRQIAMLEGELSRFLDPQVQTALLERAGVRRLAQNSPTNP
ncbi:pantetheine-phosphate adenylyltransferase [Tuwongella immobilis]|uniref:Phosphopantetheine adenylyltransferase n=1 Tax=Tuwongella immobilis TaxID=692036 RepID=A0A6C2YPB6_9BACT|nr:pantetheine-phosphate adenylyltransferase [Tuwongella immobilis]VIP03141.1 phosphopantetheine adenylyltransferase : Phosphopantetheine adenylyltransferase OS=Syntrophobotulus glycolicus (strain DSM 8271 / FlGlyR) GN=coaD PE=3 SV=1: CTP_transf_2 [Tuwongella immobilis]VTS03511.1 phosphopantetheine adenylyltransferase : Phosphopantetheine adenylyltransferase OS=Syntrophobotulus glycolicus (strain DSM 8271 / FlGlyR) GN=coaD PE=3 SV=1: CTP_transf_2 [Tuwongella immobilis]